MAEQATSGSPQSKEVRFESVKQLNTKHYSLLIDQLQKFLFEEQQSKDPVDVSVQLCSAVNSNSDRHYFYQCPQHDPIERKGINVHLNEVRVEFGRRLFEKWKNIKADIQNNSLQNNYLKYCYGILQIPSTQSEYRVRILTWIYSLCYGKYQGESSVLRKVVTESMKPLILLGFEFLKLHEMDENLGIQLSGSVESDSVRTLEKKFKKSMLGFIRILEQKNHEEAFEQCRICENHISLNLMKAHLEICETVFETQYLTTKIEELGKRLLTEDIAALNEKKKQLGSSRSAEEIEILLNGQNDEKLFFDRVYTSLGEKLVFFEIKDDEDEILQVCEQFQSHKNPTVAEICQLLRKFSDKAHKKSVTESDENIGLDPRMSQLCSKLKSSRKILSKTSFRNSSKSLNRSQSRASTGGSLKHIESFERINLKSTKSCYCFEDYSVLKLLGRGAYSEVYLVKNKNTEDLFAMKVVEVESVDEETLSALKKEQQIYKQISSDYSIQLFCSFSEENLHFFILEYASGGNLADLLEKEVYLEEDHAKVYICNLILALEQLHDSGIIHRDLKPENIVIDEHGVLKLTDFNLAFLLNGLNQEKPTEGGSGAEKVEKFFGSPDYIAPEVISSRLKHHPSRDVWSLGIITYQMLIGVTPFTAMEIQEVFQNVLRGEIQFPEEGQEEGISPQARDFILKLLEPEPTKRLGFNGISELKAHSFLGDINWGKLNSLQARHYIPKKQVITYMKENKYLKKKILDKKVSATVIESGSRGEELGSSLDSIVRYDVLKTRSENVAKSSRKSRFKLEKELNELKKLTSVDKLPPATNTTQYDSCRDTNSSKTDEIVSSSISSQSDLSKSIQTIKNMSSQSSAEIASERDGSARSRWRPDKGISIKKISEVLIDIGSDDEEEPNS